MKGPELAVLIGSLAAIFGAIAAVLGAIFGHLLDED